MPRSLGWGGKRGGEQEEGPLLAGQGDKRDLDLVVHSQVPGWQGKGVCGGASDQPAPDLSSALSEMSGLEASTPHPPCVPAWPGPPPRRALGKIGIPSTKQQGAVRQDHSGVPLSGGEAVGGQRGAFDRV